MKKTIGNLFHDMVVSARNLLTRKKEETNNMNVFPVPDGDTGINMSLTMSGVSNVKEDLTLGEAAEETVVHRLLTLPQEHPEQMQVLQRFLFTAKSTDYKAAALRCGSFLFLMKILAVLFSGTIDFLPPKQ